jgi:P27 family predicted phage terminase small subunit
MARGRPPNPDALNYLRGDPGKRRRFDITPQGSEGLPEAPEYLCSVALAEWENIVPQLLSMGVLSRIDGSALANYCEAFARYRVASDYVTAEGFTGTHYRHAAKSVVDNQALVKAYLIEFGMTPAARARMRITPTKKEATSKFGSKLRVV